MAKKLSGQELLEGVICYLPPLVLIMLFVKKRTAFITSHMKQGLIVLILAVISGLMKGSFFLMPVGFLLDFLLLLCILMGIVKVLQGKTWEIPVVGKYARQWDL